MGFEIVGREKKFWWCIGVSGLIVGCKVGIFVWNEMLVEHFG
ncbi:hypothetical protein [Priestia megaterium]|nr:hypothetical protein [Priestia megaterium]